MIDKQDWPLWLGVQPIAMKAGNTRVLCDGEPFEVDFRVVAEETWQELLKLYWECRDERDIARYKIRMARMQLDD